MKKTMLAFAVTFGLLGSMGGGLGLMIVSAPQSVYAEEAKAPAAAPVATAAPAAEAPAPVAAPAEEECGISCQLTNFQKVFSDWKALGWQAGLMALLVAIIGTFKNTMLRKWLWDWAGEAKAVVPYVLAMIACLLAIPKDAWSFSTVLLALTTGGGAVALHQLLDALKKAPWVGEKYKWLIELIAKYTKKPEKTA